MSVARHILASRTQGPEVGMDMYLNTPISKRQPAFAEIQRKRTDKTRLETYCRIFGEQIGVAVPPVIEDARIQAVQNIAEALTDEQKAALAVLGIDLGGVDLAPEQPVQVVVYTWDNPHPSAITAGQAWEALNTNGEFNPPNDMDKPASSGQLGRLNVHGMLSIAA